MLRRVEMKNIQIIWQRLVDEKGETCKRCNKTYVNLEKALERLTPLLKNLDFELHFEKGALSMDEFKRDPLSSNVIIINGKKLEEILDIKVGSSCCCGPCGDSECRTVIDESGEKEEVEERLIIKAIIKEVLNML